MDERQKIEDNSQAIKLERYQFSEMLRGLCETAGEDSIALIDDNRQVTYGQLRDAVDSLAVYLIREYGLKEGDRVGLAGSNSIDWLLHFWAVIRAGAVVIVENELLKGDEIAKHYEHQDLKFMFLGDVSDQLLESLRSLLGDKVKNFVEIPEQPTSPEETAMLDDRETAMPARRDVFAMFTSGTASKPKTIMLPQEGLMYDAEQSGQRLLLDAEYHAVFVPLSHILGLLILTIYMLHGKTVFIASKNSPQVIADVCRRFRIGEITNVPAIVKMLADHPDFEKVMKPQLDLLNMGGALLTAEDTAELEELFGAKVIIGYGMTETSGVVSIVEHSAPRGKRCGTVGRPLDDIEVRIGMPAHSGESNVFLPAGESGEVLVRGRILMNGFVEDGQFRTATDSEGFFHTGDLGYVDDEGYLHIAGRIKNIIIKGGENIMPGEIEECIRTLPEVKEVIVMGVPDELYGEEIAAVVVPEAGCRLTPGMVRDVVERNHTRFKVPGYVLVRDNLPLTNRGKPDTARLKEDIANSYKEEY